MCGVEHWRPANRVEIRSWWIIRIWFQLVVNVYHVAFKFMMSFYLKTILRSMHLNHKKIYLQTAGPKGSGLTSDFRKKQIPLPPTANFLGIVQNARLRWTVQSEAVKTRCMKRLSVMRAISGSSWGASKSILQVYRATIYSVLDYGGDNLRCKQIRDTYDKILYQALKICCGGMRETRASSLQVECGELSFDLFRNKLMANHALKSITIKNE